MVHASTECSARTPTTTTNYEPGFPFPVILGAASGSDLGFCGGVRTELTENGSCLDMWSGTRRPAGLEKFDQRRFDLLGAPRPTASRHGECVHGCHGHGPATRRQGGGEHDHGGTADDRHERAPGQTDGDARRHAADQ